MFVLVEGIALSASLRVLDISNRCEEEEEGSCSREGVGRRGRGGLANSSRRRGAEALAGCESLTELYISGNAVGSEGATALGRALASANARLKVMINRPVSTTVWMWVARPFVREPEPLAADS